MLAAGKRVAERFDDEDRPLMCKFINETTKPCIAIKILAAGRNAETPDRLEEAFRYALTNIKETDPIVVGMFPKHSDQVAQNTTLLTHLLNHPPS